MNEQRTDFWKFYFYNNTWSTILPFLLSGPFLELQLSYLNIFKKSLLTFFYSVILLGNLSLTLNTVALAARDRRKMFTTRVNASS
jgi:hypothetical protein